MKLEEQVSELEFNSRAEYQLTLKGHLDDSWSDRLIGMAIHNKFDGGLSIVELNGSVRDQAELLMLLCSLHELHLPIVRVRLHDRRTGVIHRLDKH